MSIKVLDDSLGNALLTNINNLKKFGEGKLNYSDNNFDEVITKLKDKKFLLIKQN